MNQQVIVERMRAEPSGDHQNTVLIVDDDSFNRELLGEFLSILGYTSAFAADGQEALDRMGPDISVVLLDVMMPNMDGFEVTRRIRAHPTCWDTPVILVTALTNREGKLRGVEAGANDFISKPIDLTELRVRLSAQVKMRRATQALAAAHEQELAIAAEIQSTLLLGQSPANIPGVSIAAYTASSAKIDGDFYHFFVYNNRHFDLAVADVMGKGIPAAVLGAAVKSAIQQAISRAIVDNRDAFPKPEDIVGRVHREMTGHLIRLSTFVTLAYANVDMDAQRLMLVDCGHTKTIHFQYADKSCSLIPGNNLPLGVLEDEAHTSVCVPFSGGDVFVLYSDGITEAEDSTGDFFGEQRLVDVVTCNSARDADAIVHAIRAAIQNFTGTSTISDDITCVVLKINPPLEECTSDAELEVSSSLDNLKHIGAFVTDFFSQSPVLADEDVSALELIVNEAVVNVIDHAYQGQSDKPILIRLNLQPSGASVTIYDWGDPFDESSIVPPSLDGSRFDGFGLFIIAQNTSTVTYSRDAEGRNSAHLFRQIPFHQEKENES